MPEIKYKIERISGESILRIDYSNIPRLPSIEEDPLCMAQVIELLAKNPDVSRIVFYQQREYEYDYSQTQILKEIAVIYRDLNLHESILSYQNLADRNVNESIVNMYYNRLKDIATNLLRRDPIGAYIMLQRLKRREIIQLEKELSEPLINYRKKIISVIDGILEILEQTRLISFAKKLGLTYKLGDREIYKKIFSPLIKPDFIFTKLMASYPRHGVEIDRYMVNDSEVVIFSLPDTVQYLYHITPPEFRLDEEKYELLDMARRIIAEHKPRKEEFIDPERMREVFFNIGKDLLEELAGYRNIKLSLKELNQLARILVRYTVGFGLVEILLADERVQDITINSPPGNTPIFLVHADYEDCRTNIIPSVQDLENWATKLRMISGRPFDEANPILDTEIYLPGIARARVGAITRPLNPSGIGYAFRRHRDRPWTLPLMINNKMLNPLAAGLLSFFVDGARTMLIAGTRSAGKTSLLGALMVEIMRKHRIITIEDTLELPTDALRKMGYNIQPMKVASALSMAESEVPAEKGLRTTLRLGDSCLIIGEVRSTEARALYEAMRVGALANVVAGTIHGDSPYGVYDRVVNDLGVPKTSFKATDIIVVANPIKSADGLHRYRRVTQITEVRKHWENDPLEEHGFGDLLVYDPINDELKPTDTLIQGESEIVKSIAGKIREWTGNWEAVWDNILLRARIKEEIVNIARKSNNKELMEARFVIAANDAFHKISDKVREELGALDSKRILFEWKEWLKKEVKKYS
ncbi:type II/IV secretion system ATPase subunit [Candidatus Woesearchaeota archaeon]|nr:type II/IV secretion system ATPase subunit [Candidatus Woesearchaeota archaeon]